MALQYGYDDSYDEYHFPPRHNKYDDYEYDDYNCYLNDDYLYNCNSCSNTDCTGMVVMGEGYTDNLDDYRDIYIFGEPYSDYDQQKNNKKY